MKILATFAELTTEHWVRFRNKLLLTKTSYLNERDFHTCLFVAFFLSAVIEWRNKVEYIFASCTLYRFEFIIIIIKRQRAEATNMS